MEKFNNAVVAFYAAILGFSIARAAGVPIWVNTFGGDATDIAISIAFVTFELLNKIDRLKQ